MNRRRHMYALAVAVCFLPFAAGAHDAEKQARMISEQVIYPSTLLMVQGKAKMANMDGVGSGTLVYSPTPEAMAKCSSARRAIGIDDTVCRFPLILTVYHNFIPVPGKDSGERTPGLPERPDIQPETFEARMVLALPDLGMKGMGQKTMPTPITVIAYDKKKDLALVRVDVEDTLPHVARLASRQTKIALGNSVLAAGFPKGIGPYVTEGILSNSSGSCEKTNAGQACKLILLSSNTFSFGISGGGLYQLSEDGFEYIGMPSGMGPIPSLAMSTHIIEIHTFLEENGFGFLIPEETRQAQKKASD